jgi:D-alanine-D-alanine ligase
MSFDHLFASPDTPQKCGRVAVLMGGESAERAVSLKSGGFVLQALLDSGVNAFGVDLQQNILGQLQTLDADRVFNILHGRGGEDGEVQAVLEILKLPYTGSGVKASAVTMDKLMTKRLLLGSGINTPAFMPLKSLDDCRVALHEIGLPLIIKPVNEGSSIGMSKVTRADQIDAAFLQAEQYGAVMAEQWVTGSEFTVAWLGDTVLPAIKLETPHIFYDYSAKYEANDTRYICPCGLDAQQQAQLDRTVEQVIDVCEVRDWGRVDLMQDEQGQFQVIEVNTVPGMTDHSLVPMAAKQAGLDFEQLVLKLIELTLVRGVQHG